MPPDAPSYVERQADQDLYEALSRGEFCYVLTARQMGKSSLMVRTAARLREEGIAVAILDLTVIGQNLTPEQWYSGLLGTLGEQIGREDALWDYWLEHEHLSPLHRWMGAVRAVLLSGVREGIAAGRADPRRATSAHEALGLACRGLDVVGGPEAVEACCGSPDGSRITDDASRLVLFIDEIDTVRNLPFSTDEFFAAIRACYNRRSQAPEYDRLTFCLLGVATPSDLIQDTRTTPFNIGRRIELRDLTEAEAAPLAKGLSDGKHHRDTESN